MHSIGITLQDIVPHGIQHGIQTLHFSSSRSIDTAGLSMSLRRLMTAL